MASIDDFVSELKAFFKDAMFFLTETCEDYSMNAEDDIKRDDLVSGINKLEKLMTTLLKYGGSKQPLHQTISEEIYDDTAEPNNNETEEEYLDAESAKSPKVPMPAQEIMEETYEDTGEAIPVDGGIMEDTYEDPYADGRRQEPPSKNQEDEEGAITEDMYEDPYADGKRKDPPVPPKSNEKTKQKKNKKNKEKDRHDSDNKSESSSEDMNIKKTSAAEMVNAPFKGFLKKHKAKDSFFKMSRWCAVQDNFMYYFDSQHSKAQKGAIPLQSYEASQVKEEVKKKKYVFQLSCPGKKTYFFTTNQEDDMKKWIKYLNKGELELDSEDESYEIGDPNQKDNNAKTEETIKEEPDDGIMEETYENPDDYVRSGNIQKPSEPDPEPPVPPRMDTDTPPPPTPRREPSFPPPPVFGRKAAVAPPPDDGELYDDAESALPDDDLYTDGTSAVPEPPIEQHTKPTTLQSQLQTQPLLKPVNKLIAQQASSRCSLPPPPENLINFEAMYYGLWPCQHVGVDELEFNRGECIEIVNKAKYEKDGWWVGKLGNKVGLVPKCYLAPMYKEI